MDLAPTKISNSYEMRRLALADVATTTVVWDLSKLTVRVRNKLLKWFDTGVRTNNGGRAAKIYAALSEQLGIPSVQVNETWVQWHNVDEKVSEELSKLQVVSATIARMEKGYSPYWATYKVEPEHGWFGIANGLDIQPLYQAVDEMNKANRHLMEKAKEFIKSGQRLEFVF